MAHVVQAAQHFQHAATMDLLEQQRKAVVIEAAQVGQLVGRVRVSVGSEVLAVGHAHDEKAALAHHVDEAPARRIKAGTCSSTSVHTTMSK